MGAGKRKSIVRVHLERWELESILKVAKAFRTTDHDELQAELVRRVLDLKCGLPRGVRNWRAYLIKFLYNKAANWVRDNRARERRHEAILGSSEVFTSWWRPVQPDEELGFAFQELWRELDPELRKVWNVLVEESGNQVAAARRLGKHRNTVRLWIKAIRRKMERHGF